MDQETLNSTQQPPYTESRKTKKGKSMSHKLIVDCSTGVTTEVELTAEEIAQREVDAAAAVAARQAEEEAAAAKAALKASAKAKLIAGQALTAEEADVLVL
jgi:hypothetical protein